MLHICRRMFLHAYFLMHSEQRAAVRDLSDLKNCGMTRAFTPLEKFPPITSTASATNTTH